MTLPITGGPLGCASRFDAVLTYRGTGRTAAEFDSITALSYDLRLNDTSNGTIAVGKKDLSPACRALLASMSNAEPFMHELTILRDGDTAWCGPVITSVEDNVSLQIQAQDYTALLAVRMNRTAYDYSNSGLQVAQFASDRILEGLQPDDPNVGDWIDADTSGPEKTWRAALAESSAVLTTLADMAKTNLMYTTVGRRIWLTTQSRQDFGTILSLGPDDLQGPVVVHRDGGTYASRILVQGNGIFSSWPTTPTGFDSRGLVERIITNQMTVQVDADQAAKDALASASSSTTYVRVQDGCLLDPSAPVGYSQLVPGILVQVRTPDDYLTVVDDVMTLARVSVTWQSAAEQIGISLSPRGVFA